MKQKNLLIIAVFCTVNFVSQTVCLQHELQSLTTLLQSLNQKLQSERPLPPIPQQILPPPPPAPPLATQASKLTNTRHYSYLTPDGRKLDIAFGLKNISTDPKNPLYSLAMVGPQLQKTPDAQTFIKILNSIDDQTKEITKYPPHPNEKIQQEYVILDGRNYAYEQNLENNIRKHVDVLEKRYARLQEIFQNNYQRERQLEPGAKQKGSIFGLHAR